MARDGWVKLHRKILENPVIFKDPDYLAVWIFLLLEATHSEMTMDFGGELIILKPGQLITGRSSISKKTKVQESKVERIIKRLKSEQQIEQLSNSKGRLITILNWGIYQQREQGGEQQVNNERTTSEQQVNTNKNVRMQEESYYYYKDKKTDRKSEAVASLFSKNLFAMLSGYGMSKEEFINAGYEKIDNLKDYQKALFDYKEKNGVE